MAKGQLISVDFASELCDPEDMLLQIATPQGGVCAGEVYWCMKEHVADELQRLRSVLREVRDYAAGHHSQEETHVWLHSLTVDIPHMIDHELGDVNE